MVQKDKVCYYSLNVVNHVYVVWMVRPKCLESKSAKSSFHVGPKTGSSRCLPLVAGGMLSLILSHPFLDGFTSKSSFTSLIGYAVGSTSPWPGGGGGGSFSYGLALAKFDDLPDFHSWWEKCVGMCGVDISLTESLA